MAHRQATEEGPGYSTLEVHNNHGNWTHSRVEPQVAYDGETFPEATSQPKPSTPAETELPKNEKAGRVWGLKKGAFILAAVLLALVLVGAGVGAGVGVTQSSRTSTTAENSDNGSADQNRVPSNSSVLAESKLAAANWTDIYGNSYRGVFWQAQTGSLMMSVKGPSATPWEVVDIGAAAEVPPPNFKLDVQSGTSIAAVAYSDGSNQFRIFVAYTNPGGYLRGIGCTDVRGTSEWWFDDLSLMRSAPTVTPSSQLTAWWPTYWKPDNAHVFFQDQRRQLSMLSRVDWESGPWRVGTSTPASGSGLVAVPGSRDWDLSEIMLLYVESNRLVQGLLGTGVGYGANITGQLTLALYIGTLPPVLPEGELELMIYQQVGTNQTTERRSDRSCDSPGGPYDSTHPAGSSIVRSLRRDRTNRHTRRDAVS